MRLNSSQVILLLMSLMAIIFLGLIVQKISIAYAQPSWPQTWMEIDWDKNENGAQDDMRDVEYAYYQNDGSYLYLKLECYALPGGEWPSGDARYKWFIDLDGNMYYSGGNIVDAEYLLFVEDTNHDGTGEMFLVFDGNGDNNFGETEPWPPENYADYEITNTNIGEWRIVAPYQIEMYISWASIGDPISYGLFWATDQQNPNLDQGPTTDRSDEEQAIIVHNVAALSQIPTQAIVNQGENVSIQVVVENQGTQTETFHTTCYSNNTIIGIESVINLTSGQQETIIFDWDTTGFPIGSYMITAWADSSAVISEINEEDNWCTSQAMVTVQFPPIHDVAALSQVPDKSNVVQGTVISINVTVFNFGNFVETFNVTCFYNNNPIGYQTVTNLAQQSSNTVFFPWDTSAVVPNTYYIRAMADSSDVITEFDEDNNNCTSFETVTVYSAGQMGNLFIDKVLTAVIDGEDPPSVGFSTVYELTIIVTNIGGYDVTNIEVNETISPVVNFISAGMPSQGSITTFPPPRIIWNVGQLTPGENATLTFRISVTPTSPGPFYLNYKEDVRALGIDTLSGNPVSATGQTDIIIDAIIHDVAAINQMPTSAIINQGDTVAIEVTVKNLGNVSETFDITCYYENNTIGIMRVYNLQPSNQIIISYPLDTSSIQPGVYSITAEADSSHEISESDETNNICTSPATIEIVIHDIAILSQTPSPITITQGENVTIDVVVKNEGTELETFTVSCYYNETLLEIKSVTNLQPNTTITLNFLWDTTDAFPGTYYINALAAPLPDEKDTDDNACRSVSTVTVTSLQHQIIFAQSGISSDYSMAIVIVDGSSYYVADLPISFYWNSGSSHTFAFLSPLIVSIDTKRYIWESTTGLTTLQSGSISVSGSGIITGNYKTQYYLMVSSPYGLPTPTSGWFDEGASITASITSPLPGPPGTRYICTGWTGTGSVPTSGEDKSTSFVMNQASSIIWTWKTQYYLTVKTNPSDIVSISGEGWFDSSENVPLTAPYIVGYTFLHWDVDDISRGTGTQSIVVEMNTNHTATANYRYKSTIVGGATVYIKTYLFDVWVSINFVLIILVLAVFLVRRKKRNYT
ncbi:MAG: hypothetical protein JSV05_10075 [Candidatus Bathyarchaeota archaeon]|nr:MAG: hypothetical protein JSV05_10075 [Candidatus Bathyarchaeota archaeon]